MEREEIEGNSRIVAASASCTIVTLLLITDCQIVTLLLLIRTDFSLETENIVPKIHPRSSSGSAFDGNAEPKRTRLLL